MNKKTKIVFRIISLLLILLFVLSFFPGCEFSTSEPSYERMEMDRRKNIDTIIESAKLQYPSKNEQFIYNVYDSYVKITKYIGNGGMVEIPAIIADLPVYVVDENAFKDTNVSEVIINDGVAKIGSYCFKECLQLEKISLPNTLYSIGKHAFYRCTALTEITFPESLSSIPEYICCGCTALKTLKIQSRISNSSIGKKAFVECSSLEAIYISSSVAKIASEAFDDLPDEAIFYGSAGSAVAKYCADNFFMYSVVKEETVASEQTDETETASSNTTELSTEAQMPTPSTSEAVDGSSILTLVIIIAIIGGIITYVIVKKRRT